MKEDTIKLPPSICSIIGKYLSYTQMQNIGKADPRIFKNFSLAIYDRKLSIQERARFIHENLDDMLKQKIPVDKLSDFGLGYPEVNLLAFLKKHYPGPYQGTEVEHFRMLVLSHAKVLDQNLTTTRDLPDFVPAVSSRERSERLYISIAGPSLPLTFYICMYGFLIMDLSATFKKHQAHHADKVLHNFFIGLFCLTGCISLGLFLLSFIPPLEVSSFKNEINDFTPKNPSENEYKLTLLAIHRELDELHPGGFLNLTHLKDAIRLAKYLSLIGIPAILHATISMVWPWFFFAFFFHLDHSGISFMAPPRFYTTNDQVFVNRFLWLSELAFVVCLRFQTMTSIMSLMINQHHTDHFIQNFVGQYVSCNEKFCPATSYTLFIFVLIIMLATNLVTNGYEVLRSTDLQRPLNYLYQCKKNTARRLIQLYPEHDLEANKIKIS